MIVLIPPFSFQYWFVQLAYGHSSNSLLTDHIVAAFSFPNVSIAILINHVLDPNPIRAKALLAMTWLQVVIALISVVLIFV